MAMRQGVSKGVGWMLLGLASVFAAEGVVRLTRRGGGAWLPAGLRPETLARGGLAGLPVALVLGDSIAYGHLLPGADAWPAVLERALGGRLAVVNAGVEGQTSVMALPDAPALLRRFRPQIVLIAYGLNDGNLSRSSLDDERESGAFRPAWLRALRWSRLFRGAEARVRRWLRSRTATGAEWMESRLEPRVAPAAFRRALQTLVREARSAGVQRVLLLTTTPLAEAAGPGLGDRLAESYTLCNRIVREAAAEERAELVDVVVEFTASAEMFQDDGVHLTRAGQAQLAAIVRTAMEAIR